MSKETSTDTGSMNQAKGTAIFFAWISAILIFAAVFWVLTQPLRTRILVSAVNRVLEQSGDSRRLEEPSSSGGPGFFGMSTWFSMTNLERQTPGDTGRAVVFSFIGEGTFFPCIAVLNPDGRVEEFIPLNSHGERVIRRISPGILNIYARRIEANQQPRHEGQI
jgi:hypothetical protein